MLALGAFSGAQPALSQSLTDAANIARDDAPTPPGPVPSASSWQTTIEASVPAPAAKTADEPSPRWATVGAHASTAFAGNMALGRHDIHDLRGPRIQGEHSLKGIASYYWQGQKTATGEQFDKTALTAAHKTLPFGTRVKVTRVDNGDSVIVRINDRGPFKPGRVIDLSEGAAQNIGMTGLGLTAVQLEVLGR